jgi:hypothetical protein
VAPSALFRRPDADEAEKDLVVGQLERAPHRLRQTHRATVMRKLNVNTTAVLIRYAIRIKLVEAWPRSSIRGDVG